LEGIFIKEFKSLTEAGKQTNLNFKNISFAAQKENRICGRFKWKYKI